MDTDVVVILIGVFYELLKTQSSADIWVAFGTGKNCRFLSINAICESLGEPKSKSIPVFHAVTGCDTSFFAVEHDVNELKLWCLLPRGCNLTLSWLCSSAVQIPQM